MTVKPSFYLRVISPLIVMTAKTNLHLINRVGYGDCRNDQASSALGPGQWFPYHGSATLDEALDMIENDPILQSHK